MQIKRFLTCNVLERYLLAKSLLLIALLTEIYVGHTMKKTL